LLGAILTGLAVVTFSGIMKPRTSERSAASRFDKLIVTPIPTVAKVAPELV
jgi:hypothetical protein